MAKDKSKKKSTAPANDEFAKPSEAPSGGDGWKLTEAKDELLIFMPIREEETKAFGKAGEAGEKSTIIVADVVVVNTKNPAKSETHEDVWIFQRYIQGALRGYINERKVLGRLRNTEDTTKAKSAAGGYYWELEDASAKDIEKAKEYLDSIDPFAAKGKKSKDDEDDDEPKAKDKKGKKSKDVEPEPEPKAKKKKSKK